MIAATAGAPWEWLWSEEFNNEARDVSGQQRQEMRLLILQYQNALLEHLHARCVAVLAAGCRNDVCQYDMIVLAGVQFVLAERRPSIMNSMSADHT